MADSLERPEMKVRGCGDVHIGDRGPFPGQGAFVQRENIEGKFVTECDIQIL